MAFNEDRQILNLVDSELEDLVKKWLAKVAGTYVGYERPTGSADMGRDAVGFLTNGRYDGDWHNYQCKQLKVPLGKAEFVTELGKIFYYSGQGEFVLPSKYIFVCPNSAVREVKKVIGRPSLIADFLIDNWDAYCLNGISTTPCPLTPTLTTSIRAYAFEAVELWKASELVEKPEMRAVLHEHIDIDPGEAPRVRVADVPEDIADEESAYVTQLVGVFAAASGTLFKNYAEVVANATYGHQIINARRRYLERQAFRRYFRDNLPPSQIDNVDEDVYQTVIDQYNALATASLYERLTQIMGVASNAQVTGVLGRHNRVTPSVKQGACHHFANEGHMPWI
ncbi:ABC-three component system protein [Xanthomonas campestris pv. campestris]|uniref:ABC-three component system protein n=1 Tax=Xanthomonas campestris TaxID=339 RepID=UPI0032E4FB05